MLTEAKAPARVGTVAEVCSRPISQVRKWATGRNKAAGAIAPIEHADYRLGQIVYPVLLFSAQCHGMHVQRTVDRRIGFRQECPELAQTV